MTIHMTFFPTISFHIMTSYPLSVLYRTTLLTDLVVFSPIYFIIVATQFPTLFLFQYDIPFVSLVWKTCPIAPIFKSGVSSNIFNYKPIFILSYLSKSFESIIYSLLSSETSIILLTTTNMAFALVMVNHLSPVVFLSNAKEALQLLSVKMISNLPILKKHLK